MALSTLQRRLQARAEAGGRPHSHRHHSRSYQSALDGGLPLFFFRQIASELAASYLCCEKMQSVSERSAPPLSLCPPPALQCPLCSKDVLSSEMEAHMVQCAARPRVTYNGSLPHTCVLPPACLLICCVFLSPHTADTLTQESGECSICLDDMLPGTCNYEHVNMHLTACSLAAHW